MKAKPSAKKQPAKKPTTKQKPKAVKKTTAKIKPQPIEEAVPALPPEIVTLQHTRTDTNWPDTETCNMTGDILTITKSQREEVKEYTVIARDDAGRIKELKGNTGEEFWTAYNPSLDRYYVRSKDPEKPFRTPQHMTGHRAFFEDNSKTIVWMIPRNGSCTVLASLVKARGFEPACEQPAMIWTTVGHRDCFFDVVDNKFSDAKWLEYKQCIVYQDPLYRFVRHLNYILTCNNPQINTFFAEFPEKIKDVPTVIDTYLAVAEMNAHNTPAFYEQHMIPQMFYHQTVPTQIDTIVALDDLEDFISKEMGIPCVKANLEATLGLTLDDLTEERMARFEKIYGIDREIEKRFKDRWWKAQ